MDGIGKKITRLLYDNGMIRVWPKDKIDGWILYSGGWSPFYINLRDICSKKESHIILSEIGAAFTTLIRNEISNINKIVGVATAGIPIATIITLNSKIPSCYTRKVEGLRDLESMDKVLASYGEHSLVEGDLENGDRILIVDDLITTGDSKLIAKKLIEREAEKKGINISCKDVAVIIDRQQVSIEELQRKNLTLHSLIPFKNKGLFWLKDKLSNKTIEVIQDYLENVDEYQNEDYRNRIRDDLLQR